MRYLLHRSLIKYHVISNSLYNNHLAHRLHYPFIEMRTQHLLLAILTLLAVGCQSAQPLKQSAADNGSFMGLWNVYSNCQTTTDFEQMKHDAMVLSTSAKRSLSRDSFVLPLPGKLERLVTTPSARLAVDVKAMSAACSLRAGQAAVEVTSN